MAVCRRLTVVTVLACLLAALFTHPSTARPLDEVKDTNLLRIVVYLDYRPFSWEEEDGTVKGIDADLGRAIAEELGVKAEVLARNPGEDVDDDLRSNIWQGPRTGGHKGDVMMHVPMEREFIARNNLVAISNPYYHEKVVLAVNSDLVAPGEGLGAFRKLKVACQYSTSAHYFLAFAENGEIGQNVFSYRVFAEAAKTFLNKETAGLMGRRSDLDPWLDKAGFDVRLIEPEFPATLRQKWNVGTAVKDDSRDLGYEIGKALRQIRSSGKIKKIFAKYGVEYLPPATQ